MVCTSVAVNMFVAGPAIESRYRPLLRLDPIVMAAFGVFGADRKGYLVSCSGTVAIVMGMLTGTLGGIILDVLSGVPSVLLRQEVSVAAALTGAVLYMALSMLGLSLLVSAGAGFLLALVIQGGALHFRWRLPA